MRTRLINGDAVTVALIGGFITLMIAILQLGRQKKGSYVDDLEAWVAELKAKNTLQDAAIQKLEEQMEHCEKERLRAQGDYEQRLYNLWTEINRLKGSIPQ